MIEEKKIQNKYVGRTGIVNQGVKDFQPFHLWVCLFSFVYKKMCIHKMWTGTMKEKKNEFWKKCHNFIRNLMYNRKSEVKDEVSVESTELKLRAP